MTKHLAIDGFKENFDSLFSLANPHIAIEFMHCAKL